MFKKITTTFAFCLMVVGIHANDANAQTIVDVAVGNPDFSSLVDAVVAQDLVDTLNSEGPFTVFAPTNDAFSNLPGYVGDILAEKPELLTDVLTYHVVSDELFAADVLGKKNIKTVQGESLRVNLVDEKPYINSSMITAVDVEASNGVVHVIDRVLIPKSVYSAVLKDLREQVLQLRTDIKEVKHDRYAEKRPQ